MRVAAFWWGLRTRLASTLTSTMDRPTLYLDLDGVLLVRDASRHGYSVANHAEEFLAWAVEQFDTRWLSSRCQNGDREEVRRAFRLAGVVPNSPIWIAIEKISALRWSVDKAQAIDLLANFWWLDDNPTPSSLDFLGQFGCLDRLIRIASRDPQALRHARMTLERVCRQ
jgi:hypothetical protein